MHKLIRHFLLHGARPALLLAAAAALAACSSVDKLMDGPKVDYRGSAPRQAALEVPPDLTQLAPDNRYQMQDGTVSANAFQAAAASPMAPTAAQTVAPDAIGDVRIERDGDMRWLHVPLPPDQLWPKLQAFWHDAGFALENEQPQAGILETKWAENRAKLPQDFIRGTLGKVLDSVYSTGELDKFRTRVERNPDGGSNVFITHRGMAEVYTSALQDRTVWQVRPPDPELENAFLWRLMAKLGVSEEQAKAAVAQSSAAAAASRARILEDRPAATLQVDEGFDRAWRRVGLALDRSGFTVEDRDRGQGLYFIRYVDPTRIDRGKPGFLRRLFSSNKSGEASLERYRLSVKADGDHSLVEVQGADGAPDDGRIAQHIVELLLDDLK